MFENIKEYKWVPVVIKRNEIYDKHPTALATYSKWKITIYEPFYTQSDEEKQAVLAHEYAHHIYYKMTFTEKKIWQFISTWRLIKILNIFWFTKYKKNAFTRKYAKTNYREDFASCAGHIKRLELYSYLKPFNNFADFKIKRVQSILNYYK